MSVKSATDAARRELDAAWAAKYPDGMWYVALRYTPHWLIGSPPRYPRWTIQHGRMVRRPTSGSYRGKCYIIVPDDWESSAVKIHPTYVSSSFIRKGDKRKTFDNEKAYLAFLGKMLALATNS